MSLISHEFDLHGVRLEDLAARLDQIFHQAFSDQWSEVTLITGTGPLQKEALKICQEIYECKAFVPMHNRGMIFVHIED